MNFKVASNVDRKDGSGGGAESSTCSRTVAIASATDDLEALVESLEPGEVVTVTVRRTA